MHWLYRIYLIVMIYGAGCLSLRAQPDVEYKSLEKALKTPKEVFHLSLKRDRLKEWPPELTEFPNLKVLDLSHNRISELPEDLSAYRGLVELDLTANKLDSLPESVKGLTGLKVLKLGNNEIYHVTESIGALKGLETLELWSNNIYYLPNAMIDLNELQELDLRGIQLSEEHQEAIKAIVHPRVKLRMSMSCNCD